jgi:cytochrome c553
MTTATIQRCAECDRPTASWRRINALRADGHDVARSAALGLCYACYRRPGVAQRYPRRTRLADQVLDDYTELAAQGYSREQAAHRLGMTRDALDQVLSRHRDDPRSDAVGRAAWAEKADRARNRALGYKVLPHLDAATVDAARRTVACHARDADDARTLLEALGIGAEYAHQPGRTA